MVITWMPKATNVEILMNLKKVIYPELDEQINIHMVRPMNSRTIPLGKLRLKDYKNVLFIPAEYTYQHFKQKVEIESLYSGNLLNFYGWDQLTKIKLNEIWTKVGLDVPRSIKLTRKMDFDVIPSSMYPAVIFEWVGHADHGKHTLVKNSEDIKRWMATYLNKKMVMLQKFIDFKHDDYYYKCRVIKIGSTLLPIYTHRAKEWLWHIDPQKRDLAKYDIIDFDLSWFENKIGKENFWNNVNKIIEPLKTENYAIDICLNENLNVIPFEITVPYARNVVNIENQELFEKDFKCGITHWITFLKWLGAEFNEQEFTHTVKQYVLTHGSLRV